MDVRRKYGGSDPIERVTEARPVIDTNHEQIHSKNAYSVFTRIAGLANGAESVFALTVPVGTFVHFQVATLSGNGAAELDIIESPATLTKTTVVMAPKNRHRLAAIGANPPASVLTFKNCTAYTGGTTIDGDTLYGSNQKAAVGRLGDENEWVLGRVEYLFRVTSRSVSGFDGTLRLFWYEESDG